MRSGPPSRSSAPHQTFTENVRGLEEGPDDGRHTSEAVPHLGGRPLRLLSVQSHIDVRQRLGVRVLDPPGIALDQCWLRRCFVVRRFVLHRTQVEVLVLKRVGELVDERDAQRGRERPVGHEDPLAFEVVEGEGPFGRERVEFVEEIDVPIEQTEGAHDGLGGPELAPILRGDIGRFRRQLIAILLGREEVDRHRMFEGEPALRFHEPDQVLHARVPRTGLRTFIPFPDAGNDDRGGDDERDQDAHDRPT
jgi:hypothetical protein